MSGEFEIMALYQTRAGEDRCLVIGGRANILAGRAGALTSAVAEADPDFDGGNRFFYLCLDEGVVARSMDPESCLDGRGRMVPRAHIEYPWAMTPTPLPGDSKCDRWPWALDADGFAA